jgi:hypothetical protein
MAELSPSAQSVFWAFNSKFDWIEDGVPGPQFEALAAAIEALADWVVPEESASLAKWPERYEVRRQILAIAAELRGQDQPISDSD